MPLIEVLDVSRKTFDYIVIGGGTAGLTAAGRLSENTSVSVLVLEAGNAHINDPNIEVPGQNGQTLGNPEYDWSFSTVKQKNAHDREIVWSRGKGLGGSSAINFYAWIKPPASDIDAFEKLGNPGWNWKDYEAYSKKAETFHPPCLEVTDSYPHTFNLENRGSDGPVQITIAPHFHEVDTIFQKTLHNKGLKAIQDPYGGDINGTWIASANLDPRTWTRSTSSSAYLMPNLDRTNLFILTNALVSRVILDDSDAGQDAIVKGVEFIHGGDFYSVNARREVILCAGAVKSPQILELSGIGKPSVLSDIGIECKIDLPGVGENVQEHTFNLVCYELEPEASYKTWDLLLDPTYATNARALHALGQGVHRNAIASFAYFPLHLIDPSKTADIIRKLEKEIKSQEGSDVGIPGLVEQLCLQLVVLKDENEPDCEILLYPGGFPGLEVTESGKAYLTVITVLNHPVSRGSIHCKNVDPTAQPSIDPRYFESEIDLDVLVQSFKFTRQMLDIEPWKSAIHREVYPGPHCETDQEIREFVKESLNSAWHTVGSCSMLPRNKHGVVDKHLKVYGTTNLRVADLSIIPLHISAHTQATAYVIGEKVSDFIKKDM